MRRTKADLEYRLELESRKNADLREEISKLQKERNDLFKKKARLAVIEQNLSSHRDLIKLLFKVLEGCMMFTHAQRRGAESFIEKVLEESLFQATHDADIPF